MSGSGIQMTRREWDAMGRKARKLRKPPLFPVFGEGSEIFHLLPASPFKGKLRIESTPTTDSTFTLAEAVANGYDPSAAIRRRYETDSRLCAAFVEGLLSENPTPERAREAVDLFCRRHEMDGTLLREALETALAEGGAA